MTTPAGWYTDPSNPARYRYWDGAQWTEHVHPPEGAEHAAVDPAAAGAGGFAPDATATAGAATGGSDANGWGSAAAGEQAWQPSATEAAAQATSFTSVDTGAGAVDIGTPAVVTAPGAWGADTGGYQTPAPAVDPAAANGGYDAAAYGAAAAYQATPAEYAPTAYAAAAQGAQPTAQYGPADGVGGIRTDLLSDPRYGEVGSGERVTRQNGRLLKVVLGPEVLARQGSMVAFQGAIDFDHEGAGAARFLKKALTGEGLPLMRCTGQGELFLADGARNVHIIWLDNSGLSVNGRNVLAFEPSLEWDIERVQGASMLAGGLFNTRLRGTGWVAITTKGDPVVLRTDQPTFVDTDAVVAWSAGLTTSINRTFKAKALIGKGSGEAAQLAFSGQGIVIVQPSEGDAVPPHTH